MYYVNIDNSTLGNVVVYFGNNNYSNILTSELVNMSNSTIYGYIVNGSSVTRVRWSAWSTPQYEVTNGYQTYYYDLLNSSSEIEFEGSLVPADDDTSNINTQYIYIGIFLTLVLIFIVSIFKKGS